jgi:hypothetical protein
MSARDSESGSSTYKGGSGRAGGLGNGGIGGGMGGGGNFGGGMGGGGGRMGGIGNRTGLTTGNSMWGIAGRNGVTFTGRPGGFAQQPGAFGFRPEAGVTRGPLKQPKGLLGNPAPAAVPGVNPVPEYVPQLPDMYYPPMTTPETVPGVPEPASAPPPGVALPSVLPNTLYARFKGQNYLNQWNGREQDRLLGRAMNNNIFGGRPTTQSNQTRPGANPRGWGGWASPFR